MATYMSQCFAYQESSANISFLKFILNNTRTTKATVVEGAGKHVFEFGITMLAFRNEINGKNLKLSDKEASVSTWAPLLTSALSLMPNLRVFIMEERMEDLVLQSPDFANVLFDHLQLTSIALGGIRKTASDLVEKATETRGDILGLQTIALRNQSSDIHELRIDGGMGRLLLQNRTSLTNVGLTEWNLCSFMPHPQPLQNDNGTPSTGVFPNVVHLSIDRCELSVGGLTTAFPALRTLVLGISPFIGNLDLQSHASFSNLVSISGSYDDIHKFLSVNTAGGNVRRLVVDYWDIDDPYDLHFLVLQTTPSLKSLSFAQGEVKERWWWDGLANALTNLRLLNMLLTLSDPEELEFVVRQTR